jgi:hypothetical protein
MTTGIDLPALTPREHTRQQQRDERWLRAAG